MEVLVLKIPPAGGGASVSVQCAPPGGQSATPAQMASPRGGHAGHGVPWARGTPARSHASPLMGCLERLGE